MEQTQHPRNPAVVLRGDGHVEVRDLPAPQPGPRQALIRTVATAVSTGTETTMIRGLKKEPRQIGEPWHLGYSGAGIVEAAGEDYSGPSVGSLVACYGGPYVGHATWLAVSQNLIAPASVPAEQAAFGGIGAIGMHAVRQAQVLLGERIGVLGLGVLGQIVAQLCRAAGAWVLASDPLPARRAMAESLGADAVTTPDAFLDAAGEFSRGEGLDAVLVVAGTPDSAAPAQQALSALRFRGRLQIVGNVKTEWEREGLFQKEVTVSVSRAAGPGRYDPDYERTGYAWPVGLVPWTEGRNLRSFTDLVGAGRVRVEPLITDVLPMERAADAYGRLMDAPNDHMAIVLRFPE